MRLAVAMRGGVSLAVWIGGALEEIDRLRRTEEDDALVTGLLDLTRFDGVEVDILAGASACGLNAVLGGVAIASGAPLNFRQIWMETARLDRLLDPSTGKERRRSVLNGAYFLDEITKSLDLLLEDRQTKAARPVEILLAATIFRGVQVQERDDPAFADARREAYFHARHLADAEVFSDMLGRSDAAERLALAYNGQLAGVVPGCDLGESCGGTSRARCR